MTTQAEHYVRIFGTGRGECWEIWALVASDGCHLWLCGPGESPTTTGLDVAWVARAQVADRDALQRALWDLACRRYGWHGAYAAQRLQRSGMAMLADAELRRRVADQLADAIAEVLDER